MSDPLFSDLNDNFEERHKRESTMTRKRWRTAFHAIGVYVAAGVAVTLASSVGHVVDGLPKQAMPRMWLGSLCMMGLAILVLFARLVTNTWDGMKSGARHVDPISELKFVSLAMIATTAYLGSTVLVEGAQLFKWALFLAGPTSIIVVAVGLWYLTRLDTHTIHRPLDLDD